MHHHKFGTASAERLEGVREEIAELCHRSLQISPIDFGIACGRRPYAEQVKFYNEGKSQTLDSLHLIGHAIDFLPFWRGKFWTEWPLFYPVVNAFQSASIELTIPFIWGGAWGIDPWRASDAQEMQEMYIVTRPEDAGDPFFDGPHIELCKKQYVPDFSKVDRALDDA